MIDRESGCAVTLHAKLAKSGGKNVFLSQFNVAAAVYSDRFKPTVSHLQFFCRNITSKKRYYTKLILLRPGALTSSLGSAEWS
jgi:hypothetical protein